MTRTLTATLIILTLALLPACGGGDNNGHDQDGDAHADAFENVSKAICVLTPTTGSDLKGVTGTVTFTQTKSGLRVVANVSGLKPDSMHGFHVHMFGDISDGETGKATGGHYDPAGHGEHKLPKGHDHDGQAHMSIGEHHAGDLGNLEADSDGNASYDKTFENLSLTGSNAVLGRGIIVHLEEDDGDQPTGNAGARVAQGVIGIASSE